MTKINVNELKEVVCWQTKLNINETENNIN